MRAVDTDTRLSQRAISSDAKPDGDPFPIVAGIAARMGHEII